MKHDLQDLITFFKSPLPLVFLFASLFVSPILLSSEGFFADLYVPNKNTNLAITTENVKNSGDEAPNFSFSECYFYNPSPLEILLMGVCVLIVSSVAMVLIFPSGIATVLFINNLQIFFPDWSPETFEIIAYGAFIYFNTNYWILLAYLIQSFHDNYLENKPKQKNPLSIFPNL